MEDKLNTSDLDNSYSYEHFMGEKIGKKLALLSLSYTWIAEASATAPVAMTMIEKPLIYNNVKRLERYYKKSIKKDEMTLEEASTSFEKILDIALLVRYQQTTALEEELKSIKEDTELVSLFSEKVKLNNY
jgi:hypothetical protein